MAHSFIEFRNTLPSAGAPDEDRDRQPMAGGEQSGLHAVLLLLRRVERAQPVAQLGAGHLLLELGTRQHGGEETVLIEQHVLVERHVRDADGALVAQRAVVAADRDLVDRIACVRVQAAMAVVITDRVGGAEVGDPAGFEQRDQPRLMLPETVTGPAIASVSGQPMPMA